MTPTFPRPPAASSYEKVFTGRAFLMCLLGAFGVVFAVNFTMAYLAVTTFNGVDTKSAYQTGLTYGTELTAAAEQAARGWKVDVGVTRAQGAPGLANVSALFNDRDGKPIPGLTVKARLEHPSNEFLDRTAVLSEDIPGRFSGMFEQAKDGGWTLVISGERDGQVLFKSRNRIILGQ
ncbi:MAG: FixH family protein [Beijerinckiaceae bacterium]|jgi:nitrogen fixation protein FixH